jgi:DNA-binding CsgD family transcriptional regulator
LSGADPGRRAVLDAAEELGQLARWEWTPTTADVSWSDNMFRIFGLAPGALTPTLEYFLAHVHPGDRVRVTRAAELDPADGMAPTECRVVRDDGEVKHLRVIRAVDEWRGGVPHRVIGWIRDLSTERSASREVAAHFAVTAALADCTTIQQAGPGLLSGLGQAMDFDAGVLWLRRGERLVAAATWSGDQVDPDDLTGFARRGRTGSRNDLPGLVLRLGRPLGAQACSGVAAARRLRAAERAGLLGVVGFPAVSAGAVLAVVELAAIAPVAMTDHLARSLTAIGYEIGHFIASRSAEPAPAALTPRQVEVLGWAARGLRARASAERMGVTQATVFAHFANIYERLRVTDKAAAVAEARRLGLLD